MIELKTNDFACNWIIKSWILEGQLTKSLTLKKLVLLKMAAIFSRMSVLKNFSWFMIWYHWLKIRSVSIFGRNISWFINYLHMNHKLWINQRNFRSSKNSFLIFIQDTSGVLALELCSSDGLEKSLCKVVFYYYELYGS